MKPLAILLVVCAVGACAGAPGATVPRTRNLITVEEIAQTTFTSAFEVIQSLRPEFLRTRGATSVRHPPEYALVYVDGMRAGGLDTLRTIPREALLEVRYLSGVDATTLYGTGHGGGAIQIMTRRG